MWLYEYAIDSYQGRGNTSPPPVVLPRSATKLRTASAPVRGSKGPRAASTLPLLLWRSQLSIEPIVQRTPRIQKTSTDPSHHQAPLISKQECTHPRVKHSTSLKLQVADEVTYRSIAQRDSCPNRFDSICSVSCASFSLPQPGRAGSELISRKRMQRVPALGCSVAARCMRHRSPPSLEGRIFWAACR